MIKFDFDKEFLQVNIELIKGRVIDKFKYIEKIAEKVSLDKNLSHIFFLWINNKDMLLSGLEEVHLNNESIESYLINIDNSLNKRIFVGYKINDEALDTFNDILITTIEKYIFEIFVKKHNKKKILVKNMKHIYSLVVKSDTLIIYENRNGYNLDFSNSLNITVISSKEDNNVEIKLIENNLLNIEGEIETYSLLDMKLLYVDSTFFPDAIDIELLLKKYKKLTSLIYPLFADGDNPVIGSEYSGFSNHLWEFKSFYKSLEEILTENLNMKKITVFIHDYNTEKEYYFWNSYIKTTYGKKVKVGIIVVDFDDINYYDFLYDTDYCIIDFNELLIREGIKKLSTDTFYELLIQKFRDLHSTLKERKIKGLLYIGDIENSEIIEKFMKMGYRQFKFSNKNYQFVAESANNYMSRRGLYRKKNQIK